MTNSVSFIEIVKYDELHFYEVQVIQVLTFAYCFDILYLDIDVLHKPQLSSQYFRSIFLIAHTHHYRLCNYYCLV